MRNIILITILFTGLGSSVLAQSTYRYWIPYVDTEHEGRHATVSSVSIQAFEICNVEIEGVQYQLSAYERMVIEPPLLGEGLLIESDRQVQVDSRFGTGNYVYYEDGYSQHHILEESYLDTNYIVPLKNSEISVLAIAENTHITIEGLEYTLDMGQSQRFISLPVGTTISSDKPIAIVLANYTTDHYGSTYTFQVYPISMIGTDYYSAGQHGYSHGSSTDSTRVFITAIEDETTVNINGETIVLDSLQTISRIAIDDTEIHSNKPVYAAYRSRVNGRDPWADVFRNYDAAFQLLPTHISFNRVLIHPVRSTSHGFPENQVCITSVADNNNITITCGDSIRVINLDYGRKQYYHEGEFPNWESLPMHVFSASGIHVSKTKRGWWNNISESTFGTEIIGINSVNHDVGVVNILSVPPEALQGTDVAPAAIIENYGLMQESFYVVIKNDDSYSDSIFITLTPGQLDTVFFSDWNLEQPGTHNLCCYTNLASDQYPPNDTLMTDISVTLLVTSTPSARDVSYCLNQSTVALTATPTSSAYDLFYYSEQSSLNPQSVIFPSTNAIGTTVYFVAEGLSESNCGPKIPIRVTVNPLPEAFAGLDINICIGDSVQLGKESTPGNSYSWFSDPPGFSSSLSNPIVNPKISTTYTVIETIIETGCADTSKMNRGVLVESIPVADFRSSPKVAVINKNIDFENLSSEAVLYEWNFNDGSPISADVNPNHTYTELGYYNVYLIAINEFGCADTLSKLLAVTNDKLHPPTAFSPNGEHIEDREFRIHSPDIKEHGYNLLIFNRWGEIIFESKTQNKGWDGNMKNGNPAPPGGYTWVLQYLDFIGEIRKQQGNITLLY